MGFGNECGHADIDLAPAAGRPLELAQAKCKIHHGIKILIALSRQPDHEVKLDQLPSHPECASHGFDDFGFADVLVDHVPQSLTSGLRCNREAGLANLPDKIH